MPPQSQTGVGSAQANEDSVKAFMELDDAGQTHALSKMSPEAKSWLLLGVRALKSVEPQGTPQKEDQGIISGVVGRAVGTAKSIKSMVMPTEEEDVEATKAHLPARIGETYKEGARQTREQFKAGAADIRKGLPVEGALSMAHGAVTGASLLDPFATGSVVDINRMQDEGRYREAIGTGAFDVLALWMGRGNKAAKSTMRLNKLVGATGGEIGDFERVLPEIEQASKKVGRARTVGQLQDIIDKGSLEKEAEFRRDFDPIKHNRAYTPAIKNHIDRIIRENPNLTGTPEGRSELAALRRVQRLYDKPHTLEFMNLERSRLRKQIRQLYNAPPSDAVAKLKLDAELRAKKVVADSFSETVNDHLAHVTGKPREYYDILRQKQDAFIDLQDHMDKEVKNLRNQEATHAGKNLGERVRPHAYASGAGPRVHFPFSETVRPGPMEIADSKVRQAFRRGGPENRARTLTRMAARALPVSHLVTAGEEAKKSRMTPPPELEE